MSFFTRLKRKFSNKCRTKKNRRKSKRGGEPSSSPRTSRSSHKSASPIRMSPLDEKELESHGQMKRVLQEMLIKRKQGPSLKGQNRSDEIAEVKKVLNNTELENRDEYLETIGWLCDVSSWRTQSGSTNKYFKGERNNLRDDIRVRFANELNRNRPIEEILIEEGLLDSNGNRVKSNIKFKGRNAFKHLYNVDEATYSVLNKYKKINPEMKQKLEEMEKGGIQLNDKIFKEAQEAANLSWQDYLIEKNYKQEGGHSGQPPPDEHHTNLWDSVIYLLRKLSFNDICSKIMPFVSERLKRIMREKVEREKKQREAFYQELAEQRRIEEAKQPAKQPAKQAPPTSYNNTFQDNKSKYDNMSEKEKEKYVKSAIIKLSKFFGDKITSIKTTKDKIIEQSNLDEEEKLVLQFRKDNDIGKVLDYKNGLWHFTP